MFTGLIEEIAIIRKISKSNNIMNIDIKSDKVLEGTKIDDSISVNGVCLTVVGISDTTFKVQVVEETIHHSTLKNWRTGLKVNVERAMPAMGRFGGHFVQGHVDNTAKITHIYSKGDNKEFHIHLPNSLSRYIVQKGSITIDGVSLTIAEKTQTDIMLSLIPHTLNTTTLGFRKSGDWVNIEIDILAKYVHEMSQNTNKTVDKSTLLHWGYKL